MEQPQLGDDIAALTVPSGEAKADRVTGGPVPGLPQSLPFGYVRRCLRKKPRQGGNRKRDRLEVRSQRGPEPPRMSWKNVKTDAAGRQHAAYFAMHTGQIRHVLQHI
jgi:hypothetical protein